MGTQGILSIIQRGRTAVKIVVGCNGMNVPDLAKALYDEPTTDVKALLTLCSAHDVGCDRCLIVQTSPIEFHMPEGQEFEPTPEDLERYKTKFTDPRFNPRWDHGTAAYLEVVDLDLCQTKSQPRPK